MISIYSAFSNPFRSAQNKKFKLPKNIEISLYDYQYKVEKAVADGKPFAALCSGTGVGKTHFGTRWISKTAILGEMGDYLAMSPYNYQSVLLIMPQTIKALNEFGLVQNEHFTVNKSYQYIEFKHNNARLHFRGADNPFGIQGFILRGVYLDECGLYPETAWITVQQRRSFFNAPTILGSTPYWWGWYKNFYEKGQKNDPDVYSIRVPTWENPDYSREAILFAAKNWPSWKFKMMFMGLFTRPIGVIFHQLITHTIDRFSIPDNWPQWGSIDFGSTHPTAILWFAQDPLSQVVYVIREWRKTEVTVDEISNAIKHYRIPYYCDPENKISMNSLAAKGHNIKPAIKKVEDGILEVQTLFNGNNLYVFKDCEKLIDESTKYSWELDRDEKPKPKPVKKEDDLCDALRYGINSWFGDLSRGSLVTGTIPLDRGPMGTFNRFNHGRKKFFT